MPIIPQWHILHRKRKDQARAQLPTFLTELQGGSFAAMGSALTINGATETPAVELFGQDASANGWTDNATSTVLAQSGSGSAPTYDRPVPMFGIGDAAVKFNDGKHHAASDGGTLGDITTQDLTFELIFKMGATQNSRLVEKVGASFPGWYFFVNAGKIEFQMGDGSDTGQVGSAVLAANTWYVLHGMVNRSEASTNGVQLWVNAVTSGAGADFSAVDSVTTSTVLSVGASEDEASVEYDNDIALFRMWKRAAWHQEGASGITEFGAIVQERFYKAIGIWPQIAEGTALPETVSQASAATIQKEISTDVYQLFTVGPGWIPIDDFRDASGNKRRGMASFPQTSNRLDYSDGLNNWTEVNNTTNTTAADGPFRENEFSAIVTDDAVSDVSHGWTESINPGAGTWRFECYAKKGAQDWLYLADSSMTKWVYFDLNNGVLGNDSGGLLDTYIEPQGSGIYLCGFVWSAGLGAHTLAIYASDQDDNAADPAYIGDGSSDDVYVSAVMALKQSTEAPHPHIRSSGSVTTANRANLQFKGNDGNAVSNPFTIAAEIVGPNYNNTSLLYAWSLFTNPEIYAGYIKGTDVWEVLSDTDAYDTESVSGDASNGERHSVRMTGDDEITVNDLYAYRNGVRSSGDTIREMNGDPAEIWIASDENATNVLEGHIWDFRIFDDDVGSSY
jgi:hypothetical protein